MEDLLGITIMGILVILYFYYGYRHDYRRNPKQFIKTIIGVPLLFLNAGLGLFGMNKWITKWMNDEKK